MRIFIAIFPPQEYRNYFRDVIRKFDKQKRNLKAAPMDQMHLTLRFLGTKVSPHSKKLIVKELQKQAGSYPKPQIALEKLQFGFPRQKNPRILFAVIAPNPELDELVDRIHHTVRAIRARDTIVWKSNLDNDYHITLARLKPAATRSTGRQVKNILETVDVPLPEPFIATEMHVMQSELTNKGPVYRKLEQIKL